jgi:ZIP family zinc transporter
MWAVVVLVCGIVAGLGFAPANASSEVNGERAAALAAGGVLTMLTNSRMPFAFQRGGTYAGIFTVVGFGLSIGPT